MQHAPSLLFFSLPLPRGGFGEGSGLRLSRPPPAPPPYQGGGIYDVPLPRGGKMWCALPLGKGEEKCGAPLPKGRKIVFKNYKIKTFFINFPLSSFLTALGYILPES